MADNNHALAIVPDSNEVKSLAKRLVPQFPSDCNAEQAADVARVAVAYGLDPFLGELIPYKGKPYLTFDGRIRIADNHPAYDGYDHGPVLGDERTAFMPQNGEVIWKCTVYRRDRSRPTVAYGRAGGDKETNPIAKKDPVTMAQKRAIHRALRAAFPVPIPGGDDDPVTPAQLKAIHATDSEQGITVTERHEVLEATFGVGSSKDLTAAQAGAYLDERAAQKPAMEQPAIEVTARPATPPQEPTDPPVGALLSARQQRRIYELRDELGKQTAELNAAIQELYKVDSIEGLSEAQASRFIRSLQRSAEKARQQQADDVIDAELADIPF
ncbi:recombinase RecT [Nitrolancea hollandica]|uniref:Phage recombination protein Bet n=1 Tax=Nitrolancea hollandica Lb TaxID=1129897 RepID=I4EG05_9BACT|nr:recombinase RecT [Nitrolancea hollandica]CCF83617.1 hypothetical protein NITHO_2510015 [Nitrolancea hollandica Lb]